MNIYRKQSKDIRGLRLLLGLSFIVAFTFRVDAQCSDFTYGGQTYTVGSIGTQCWMLENANWGTFEGSGGTQSAGGKFCYGDDTVNCDTYGGLYQFGTVLGGGTPCNGTGSSQPACSTPVQGICPSGWHVPSQYEYIQLFNTVCGGTSTACTGTYPYSSSIILNAGTLNDALQSTSGFVNNGTNTSTFNTQGGGTYRVAGGSQNGSRGGYYWTSTEGVAGTNAFMYYLWDTDAGICLTLGASAPGEYTNSLRCVSNASVPVSFISLTAKTTVQGEVLIEWKTGSEINNQYFEIQKSADGRNFSGMDTVSGAGNSNTHKNYSFTDNNPEAGKTYYRLKQVDFDGSVNYSWIVSVQVNAINNLMVFPNPVEDELKFSITALKQTTVYVIIKDELGRERMTREYHVSKEDVRFAIDVSELAEGMYLLQIFSADDKTSLTEKFVIRK